MKAVRLHGVGDLRVEEVTEAPIPGPNDARVKVLAAGICGSDLHNFRTGQWISRGPSIPGHEFVGEVEAVGCAVCSLKVGDRVVADSRVACGTCAPCQANRRNLCVKLGYLGEVCDGGFAERVTLPAAQLLTVAPDLDPRVAVLAEPLAVALHAVQRLAPDPKVPVLITGCGSIGGLAALALARENHGLVLIADHNEARTRLVAEVTGATPVTLDADVIAQATGGRPLTQVIEATGSVAVLDSLTEVIATGSRLVLVGIFHGTLTIDPNLIVEREWMLAGCSAFADELPEATQRLPLYATDLARFVDGPIPLAAVPNAFARLIRNESRGLKTIIEP